MNDNIRRIDDFLKYWARIASQNPHLDLSSEQATDYIYHDLIHLGVKENEKNINLGERPLYYSDTQTPFDLWQRIYKNNPHIKVFVAEDWKYFCQFVSRDEKAYYEKDHIKVYIPLDAEHIELGAKYIFDFLTMNNISHLSKIGKHIRFDDIVIRLTNKEDADKLLDFVNRSPYLQQGLIKANPFAFQKNGIALACDGSESYNSTIASLIAKYLDDKRNERQLSKVSYQDFYRFIATKYKQEFVSGEDHSLAQLFDFEWDKTKRANYKEILTLILKVQNPSFSYEDFISHYEQCAGKRRHYQENNSEALLVEAIGAMIHRWNSQTIGINSVEGFIYSGKSDLLTRRNNLRDRILSSSMRQDTLSYMEREHISFRDYLGRLRQQGKLIDEDMKIY